VSTIDNFQLSYSQIPKILEKTSLCSTYHWRGSEVQYTVLVHKAG